MATLTGTEVELAKVATPMEAQLIRELLGYEAREHLGETDLDRVSIIKSFLAEEDNYKRRPAKPVGSFQPIPAKTPAEQNAISTQWAKEGAEGAIPTGIDQVFMGSMVAHLVGVPADQIPSGLRFETVDGYSAMMKRQAESELADRRRKAAIEKALARLENPPWYARLWSWIKES